MIELSKNWTNHKACKKQANQRAQIRRLSATPAIDYLHFFLKITTPEFGCLLVCLLSLFKKLFITFEGTHF